MNEINKVKETIEATTALVEAIPVYQDLVQPAAQEIGKGLHTVSKLIHVALAPVSAMVWGYEKIADYLQTTLESKLENVPPENIISPDISIAGPAIESMRFTGEKEELQNLFANLIATSMNIETAHTIHPSYVEIIKQLSSDEARIISYLKGGTFPFISVNFNQNNAGNVNVIKHFSNIAEKAGCLYPQNGSVYLDNLIRLNFLLMDDSVFFAGPDAYNELEQHPYLKNVVEPLSNMNSLKIKKGIAKSTSYGLNFFKSCVSG